MAGYPGKQGRKPKPTSLKELAGTLRPHRVNRDEPAGDILTRTPPCPSHITGVAAAAWRSMSRKLVAMKVLTTVDLPALEAYCTIYARWKEAQAKLDQYGMVIPKDGWFLQSPYLPIVDNCLKQMRAYMAEFGITPSSRSRVKAQSGNDTPEDPFAEYLNGQHSN